MTLENSTQVRSLLTCIGGTMTAAIGALSYIEPRDMTIGEAACIFTIVSFFAALVGLVLWILLQLCSRGKSCEDET